MPKKMRRSALRSALSAKAAEKQILVLDELIMDKPKTKDMATTLKTLVGDESALILLVENNEAVEKSVRNLPMAKTLRAGYLNIRDLFSFDRLIIPKDALEAIRMHLGS